MARVDEIKIILAGDESAAQRAALQLLEHAQELTDTLTYRAAWLGSPAPLGGFGVHRDAAVTPDAVAAMLEGRNARTGAQVRRPRWITRPDYTPQSLDPPGELAWGLSSVEVTLEAPLEWTGAWYDARDADNLERLTAIEDAVIARTDAVLERIRQARPLAIPDMPSSNGIVDLDAGLAAVAIVQRPPGERPLGQPPLGEGLPGELRYVPLRVSVVVFSVERLSGELAGPSMMRFLEAEPTLAEAAREAFAELPSEPQPPGRLVGRETAWVPDPFDRHRSLVGNYAQGIDDLATLYGEEFVNRPDAWLAERAAELGNPLARLDPYRAQRSVEVDRRIVKARSRLWLAEEDLLVLEARVTERLAPFHVRAAVDAQRERVQTLRREADEAVAAYNEIPEARYLDDRMPQELQPAAEWLAIVREQAIREGEQMLREEAPTETAHGTAATVDRDARELPPNARRIGRGDVSSILEEMFVERHQWRERHDDPDAARSFQRSEVRVPATLDQLRELVGNEDAERLTSRAALLAERLADLPDDWLETRHAVLGDPLTILDRGGALATRRIERFTQLAKKRVRHAELEIDARQDELETAELDGADRHELRELRQRLDAAHQELSFEKANLRHLGDDARQLRESGVHLRDELARHEDRLVRAMAYADERALRRELALWQQTERVLVEPSERIVGLLGPVIKEPGPERLEWQSLARHLEYDRLKRQTEGQTGINPRDRPTLRDLYGRIERLRAKLDLPALAQARGREATSEPPGRERR